MTAVAATRTTAVPVRREKVTFFRAVRSEWIKLASLRSTWWSIAIVVVISLGVSLLLANVSRSFHGGPEAVNIVTAPIQFTALLAGILGAIAITGEYSTGMIRSTLTAVPRRGTVLLAKALVVAVLLAVVSLVISLISSVLIVPVAEISMPWDDPSKSMVPLLWAAFSMAVFALIGLSCGFLVRSGAGAIAIVVAIIFVVPVVIAMFPLQMLPDWQWLYEASRYLPMNIVPGLLFGYESALPIGAAVAGLLGWVVAGLAGSYLVLRSRDA